MVATPLIVVDAHEDIAYNYVAYGRDYRESAYAKRDRERGAAHVQRTGNATLGLPDALLGRVALTYATLFVAPRKPSELYERVAYTTPREAYTLALQQWDYYQRLVDEDQRLRLVTAQADLDAVLATWGADQPLERAQQGLVLLMEGADPILEPKQFEDWYERGVRIVGPAWERTRYSGGTKAPDGLTALGRELLEVLAAHNVILDLSHMAEEAYMEALDRFDGKSLIASHSNLRRLVDTDRHLSDVMVRRLAERDGVIGVVFYNYFLNRDWRTGEPRFRVPLTRVIDVIDAICQLTGSAAHVGIGTDMDGGFGVEDIPDGIDTILDVYGVVSAGLHARGFGEADIAAILGGNMLRKLREALP
jgi:membrane dipeptidase